MWIFSQEGFISVELHTTPAGDDVVVSARDKKALDALAASAGAAIAKAPKGEYPYRVFITKRDLAEWLAHNIDALDYLNFAQRISKKRGHPYSSALDDVAVTMRRVEDADARSGLRPGFIRNSLPLDGGPH